MIGEKQNTELDVQGIHHATRLSTTLLALAIVCLFAAIALEVSTQTTLDLALKTVIGISVLGTGLAIWSGYILSNILKKVVLSRVVKSPLIVNKESTTELLSTTDSSSELELLNKNLQEMTELLSINQTTAENYRLAAGRFQRVLASIPVPCIGCDATGNVYEWNAAAQSAFGKTHMDVFENSICQVLFTPEFASVFQAKIHEAVEKDEELQFELESIGAEKTLLMDWSLTPVRGGSGQISSLLITAVDITEHIEQQQFLEELASKDAMTKLLNRRAFLELFSAQHAQSNTEFPVSVIFMDVDKFKVFNDTYGHSTGDEVLKTVGQVLTETCGNAALPARFGGEEFIVMAANHDEEEAAELAENLRQAFQAATKDTYGCTASFGVSCTFSAELTVEELIEQADQALYAAKEGGRNQVRRASTLSSNKRKEDAA